MQVHSPGMDLSDNELLFYTFPKQKQVNRMHNNVRVTYFVTCTVCGEINSIEWSMYHIPLGQTKYY